jgi:hypothetical protein
MRMKYMAASTMPMLHQNRVHHVDDRAQRRTPLLFL